MNDFVIEAKNLTKYFGANLVVNSLNLQIRRGAIYGLLGRNGAGKTTTIKMLMGFLRPTRGRSTVLGCDSQALTPDIKRRVGYLAEGHPLYTWMTIRKIARFTASFYSSWNHSLFEQIIEYFDLPMDQKIRHLSHGQRAQVSLALVLAPEPELLIMDDPLLRLDAVVRREFLQAMIEVIQKEGRTILFSSHILSDVERVADRVAIMDRGVLMADCPTDTLRERIRKVRLRFEGAIPTPIEIPGKVASLQMENELYLTIINFSEEHRQKLQALKPAEMEVIEMGLEDMFIEYTAPKRERRLSLSKEA
jgi:ABC-2 type transport system ATP-binding protein